VVPAGSRAPAAGFIRTASRQAISSGPRARRPFCMIPRGRFRPSGRISSGPTLLVFQEDLAPPGTAIGSKKRDSAREVARSSGSSNVGPEDARTGEVGASTTWNYGAKNMSRKHFCICSGSGRPFGDSTRCPAGEDARTGVESPEDRRRVRSPLPATPPRAGSQGKRLTDSRSSVRRARATTSGSLLAVPHSRPLSASRAARPGSAVSSAAVSVRP
jgi:hypothetical protein